jgi:hypothetical protein
MKLRTLLTTYLVSIALLTGCGGGGGGGAGNASSMGSMPSMPGPILPPEPLMPINKTSAPGEAALVGYLQSRHQYMLTAQSAGLSYSLNLNSAPNPGTTMFNGSAPAYSTAVNFTITEAHAPAPLTSSLTTAYYLMNPYVPLGIVSGSGSPYAVVKTYMPFPVTITLGTSGTIDDLTYYHDSTMSTMDAEETIYYTVTAQDSMTLLLCLNSTFSNVTAQGTADGMANGTQSDCYTVDSAGVAALASITLTAKGNTLSFQ